MEALVRRLLRCAGCALAITYAGTALANESTVSTPYGAFPIGAPPPLRHEIPAPPISFGALPALPPLPRLASLSRELVQVSFFDSTGRVYENGLEQYQQQKDELALRRFSRVLLEAPQGKWAPRSLFWQGQLWAHLNKPAQAIEDLKQWLRRYPQATHRYRSSAYLTLAWVHAKDRNCVQSQVWIDRARTLGNLTQPQQKQAAQTELACALQTNSSNVGVVFQRLQAAAASQQEHAQFLTQEANYHFRQDDCGAVTGLYESSFERYYNYSEIEDLGLMTAWCQVQQAQWDAASATVGQLQQRGLQEPDQLHQLELELALQRGDERDIRQALNTFRSRERLRENAYRVLWWAATEQRWEFVKNFEPPFQEPSRLAELRLLQVIAQQQQASDVAPLRSQLERLRKSQELARRWQGEALYQLIRLELQAARPQVALRHCNRLVTEFVESSHLTECYFWQAALLNPEQDGRAVSLALRQVPPEAGRDEEMLLIRARLAFSSGKWLDARSDYQQLVTEYPNSTFRRQALLGLVQTYEQLEFYREALEQLAILRAEPSAAQDVELLALEVRLLRKLKRSEPALKLLSEYPNPLPLELERIQLALLWELQLWEGFLQKSLEVLPQLEDPRAQAELHFQRGQAHEQQEAPLRAIPAYEKSLQNVLKPAWEADAQFAIVRILYELEEVRFAERAEALLREKSLPTKEEVQVREWLIERYLFVNEPKRTIPHRQQLIRFLEDQLREDLDATVMQREQWTLLIAEQHLALGELQDKRRPWEQAESWAAELQRSADPATQRIALLLSARAAFELEAYERAVAAYLQVMYFHAEGLNEEQKFQMWQRMGAGYEELGRSADARAIYRKIRDELTDPAMQQFGVAALQRLDS